MVISFLNLIHSFETGFSTAINSCSFILSRLNSLRRVFDSSLGKLPCPLTQFINLSITLIGEKRERETSCEPSLRTTLLFLLAFLSSSFNLLDVRNQHETAVATVTVSERLSSFSTC